MHETDSTAGPLPGAAGAATLSALLMAGVQVLLLDVSPVGRSAPDLFWVGCLAALAVAATSYAPRAVLAVGALVSLGFATTPGVVSGFLALIGLTLASRRDGWSGNFAEAWESIDHDDRRLALLYGMSSLLVSGGLFWSTLSLGDYGIPLLSAGVAAGIWAVVSVAAITQLTSRARIRVVVVGGVALLGLGVVIVGAGLQVRDSVQEARQAERSIRTGLNEARSGDLFAARDSVADASASLDRVVQTFSSPLVSALAHLPAAGHNVSAARAPLGPATEVMSLTQSALDQSSDLRGLLDDDGVNVDRVEALATTSEDLLGSISGLGQAARNQSNPWIVQPLQEQLAAIDEQSKPAEELSDLEVADALLELLGSESSKSYLLLFGNNAEARELGGFVGAFALLNVDDGSIEVAQADRTLILDREGAGPEDFTTPPNQRFLEHRPWLFPQNYTGMADFPSLGLALADLFPAASGAEIDGLLYLDPQALAAIVGLVGEVHLPNSGLTVTSENLARIVQVEQYELFDPASVERGVFLQELVTEIFGALLTQDLDPRPGPVRALIQATQQDRLLILPFDDNAFELAERASLIGGVPAPAGQDYLAVSHLNGGPNKLDVYLHRDIDYNVRVNPDTGSVEAHLSITLTNSAPARLPDHANGNRHGYDAGTNRAFVVVHTPHDVVSVSGATEPTLTRSWEEFGWQRHETVVAIPQGESRTVEFWLAGRVSPGSEYRLDIGHQPLITNDDITVALSSTNGLPQSDDERLAPSGQSLQGTFRLTEDGEISATLPEPTTEVAGRTVGSASQN